MGDTTAGITAGVRSRAGSSGASAAGQAARRSGAATGGPGRLSTSTDSAPGSAARSRRRSGAGEASCCAVSGRQTNTGPSQPAASTCSRRSWAALACGSQAMTAPQALARMSCSVVHSRSAGVCGASHSSRAGGRPSAHRPGACGGWGGATKASGRRRPRQHGASRRASTAVLCGASNSVSA